MFRKKIPSRLIGGPEDGAEIESFGELVIRIRSEEGDSQYIKAFSDRSGLNYVWAYLSPVARTLRGSKDNG